MLYWCQTSPCFHCSSLVPNASLNVALGQKMHLTLSLLPALLSQLGSFLLDGNTIFVCTGEEPGASHGWRVMHAEFGLYQYHSRDNLTCIFGKISFFCLDTFLSHPLLLHAARPHQKGLDTCNGYGLVLGGHQPGELITQWYVWAQMSPQGSEPIV